MLKSVQKCLEKWQKSYKKWQKSYKNVSKTEAPAACNAYFPPVRFLYLDVWTLILWQTLKRSYEHAYDLWLLSSWGRASLEPNPRSSSYGSSEGSRMTWNYRRRDREMNLRNYDNNLVKYCKIEVYSLDHMEGTLAPSKGRRIIIQDTPGASTTMQLDFN